jgi:hypothetical protein
MPALLLGSQSAREGERCRVDRFKSHCHHPGVMKLPRAQTALKLLGDVSNQIWHHVRGCDILAVRHATVPGTSMRKLISVLPLGFRRRHRPVRLRSSPLLALPTCSPVGEAVLRIVRLCPDGTPLTVPGQNALAMAGTLKDEAAATDNRIAAYRIVDLYIRFPLSLRAIANAFQYSRTEMGIGSYYFRIIFTDLWTPSPNANIAPHALLQKGCTFG